MMDKYSTPASGNSGPRVVVEFDDDVVEMVHPAQAVAWFIGRAKEGPVVAAVGRILAPGVSRSDPPDRKAGAGPDQPIGAPPHLQRMKTPSGRAAVPLALIRADTAAAQRNRENACPGE
jgi:hypothetical protein